MKLFLRLLMPVVLLSGLTSGCAVQKENIRGFNLISIQEEKQLGDQFAAEVEKQFKLVNDPEIQGYVDQMGKRLLTGAREIDFDYTFKVVKDDSVNAFAVPGGHIYIHTGLIKAARNEDELAGVVAHEINHIVARHGTRQLTQRYGYGLLMQLILGKDPNMLASLAASLFGQAGGLAYSRSMESQADYLGVETMHKAGYNPQGMLSFFEKLDSMGKENPGRLTQFFSSHPLTSDRIKEVNDAISKLPPAAYTAGNSAAFAKIKKKVE